MCSGITLAGFEPGSPAHLTDAMPTAPRLAGARLIYGLFERLHQDDNIVKSIVSYISNT
jgi:hypothetical protein